ncbi:hypothetical protein ACPV3A_29590 [Paenibacillus sp. Dod16]|uniref:hypothetical protein n=1 Tax=Paenibacillus sp. Dod16 TaxID=3416392 RepID=UPI003CF3320D
MEGVFYRSLITMGVFLVGVCSTFFILDLVNVISTESTLEAYTIAATGLLFGLILTVMSWREIRK